MKVVLGWAYLIGKILQGTSSHWVHSIPLFFILLEQQQFTSLREFTPIQIQSQSCINLTCHTFNF